MRYVEHRFTTTQPFFIAHRARTPRYILLVVITVNEFYVTDVR